MKGWQYRFDRVTNIHDPLRVGVLNFYSEWSRSGGGESGGRKSSSFHHHEVVLICEGDHDHLVIFLSHPFRESSFDRQNFMSDTPGRRGEAEAIVRWRDRAVMVELVATLAALALTLILFSRFILFVESRAGVVLPDPILASFAARDFTIPIFTIINGGILLALITLVRHPDALLLMLRSYSILMLVRMAAMYTIPLEPPAGMVLLVDPIYSVGPGSIITRDLFFSGHTATMFLLMLTARRGWVRNVFLLCTLSMAVLLLWQKCHYTIDVLSAPFFAYTCYRLGVVSGVGDRRRRPR
jgi:hypothetical protein